MGVIVPNFASSTEDRTSGAQIIDGGLRFNSAGATYLSRTPASAGNRTTFTFSCWVKLTNFGSNQTIFAGWDGSASNQFEIRLNSDNTFFLNTGGESGNRTIATTAAVFRDPSAWYHLVCAVDTTQASASDHFKFYINNSLQTLSLTASGPQNLTTQINGTFLHHVGVARALTRYFNGYLADIHFIDGQALTPSSFGYTDPLTNTWRPKKYTGTFTGTNTFYLPLDGNTPIGQDQSGRGNNWTPVNFGGSNTIEKATGALPILNTDGGGKVARVGVRTDSNASSLVLATPLVGIASDFSNKINSGTTEKVMTVSGATADTASNFYGGSYKFVAASSQQITTPGSSDFAFGTGDFCVECWYYNDTSGGGTTYNQLVGNIESSAAGFWRIGSVFAGGNQFWFTYTNGNYNDVFTNININDGRWHHLAATRESGTLRLFVDGVVQATATVTQNFSQTTTLRMMYSAQQPGYANGYLQDVRIYKGLAKYTQNFIPASTDPDILPDTPSGVAYSSNVALVPSTDGAVAFDGSGDYLSLASSADLTFGTGDFTLEYFINTKDTDFNFMHPASSSGSGYWGHLIQSSSFKWNDAYATTNLWEVSATPILDGRWHHCAICRASGVTKVFFDGVSQSATSGTFTDNTNYSGVDGWKIGGSGNLSDFNGFLSNLHIVKGTALYTSNFTPPTAPITSVANTKLLCCKSQTSATAFDVSPGSITATNAVATNFNPFTANINAVRGQESGYATLNPLNTQISGSSVLQNGNLTLNSTSATYVNSKSTLSASAFNNYSEMSITTQSNSNGLIGIGVGNAIANIATGDGSYTTYRQNGEIRVYPGNSLAGTVASYTQGDVIGMTISSTQVAFYKNNILQGTYSHNLTGDFFVVGMTYNNGGTAVVDFNFGQKPFKFPPPAGFQPLALANTPRPTIVRPDQYVGIVTYTGTASVQSITGIGNFKPDFVWIKDRGVGWNHQLYDSVRGVGANKELTTSQTWREGDTTNMNTGAYGYVSSLDASGFTLNPGSGGAGQYVNQSTKPYVAWCWKAGGNSNTFNINDIGYSTASAAGLTAGTITPTGASVNTKSGFSIIGYTGTGANATISHGLGNAPAFMIVKMRTDAGYDWCVYHSKLTSAAYALTLQTTAAEENNGPTWNSTAPTSTVFSIGNRGSVNLSGKNFVAYLWAEIPGFSKFGSYSGNQSADGPTIITGFRPRFIMIKSTSAGTNWRIIDTERSKYNPGQEWLLANSANAEPAAERPVDILSNGFKIRVADGGDINYSTSALTYIYAAFAETPSFNLYGGQANAR